MGSSSSSSWCSAELWRQLSLCMEAQVLSRAESATREREREQSSVWQHLCTCHTCHTALALAQAGHVIYQAQLKAFGLVRCQGWTADNSGGDILNSFNHSCQLSVYDCVLGIVLHHKGATHTHIQHDATIRGMLTMKPASSTHSAFVNVFII